MTQEAVAEPQVSPQTEETPQDEPADDLPTFSSDSEGDDSGQGRPDAAAETEEGDEPAAAAPKRSFQDVLGDLTSDEEYKPLWEDHLQRIVYETNQNAERVYQAELARARDYFLGNTKKVDDAVQTFRSLYGRARQLMDADEFGRLLESAGLRESWNTIAEVATARTSEKARAEIEKEYQASLGNVAMSEHRNGFYATGQQVFNALGKPHKWPAFRAQADAAGEKSQSYEQPYEMLRKEITDAVDASYKRGLREGKGVAAESGKASARTASPDLGGGRGRGGTKRYTEMTSEERAALTSAQKDALIARGMI